MAEVMAVIPARYGSTRLPGKALADIGGEPMIVRVYRRVSRAKSIRRVLVATDDQRIVDVVQAAGGEAIMTSSGHASGTDRIAEVAERFSIDSCIVNVQGDEPFIEPAIVDALAHRVSQPNAAVVTAATSMTEEVDNPARVKVVVDPRGQALYFSRSAIPYGGPWRRHLGLYAFQPDALRQFAALPPSLMERSERLEQLRFLENRIPVWVIDVPRASLSVDTPDDLAAARRIASHSG